MPECPDCGGPVWDNRPKKSTGEFSAKSPDFKCKDKECGGVIWPEKKGGGKFVRANPPPERSNGGAMSRDDYWARKEDFDREKEARWVAQQPRIDRMHAHKVTIAYMELKGLKDLSFPEIITLIDWWQRDIGRSPIKPVEDSPGRVVQSEPEQRSGDIVISDEPPF